LLQNGLSQRCPDNFNFLTGTKILRRAKGSLTGLCSELMEVEVEVEVKGKRKYEYGTQH
jgi:hypothetical protein